jgi:hypothetical protein
MLSIRGLNGEGAQNFEPGRGENPLPQLRYSWFFMLHGGERKVEGGRRSLSVLRQISGRRRRK